jgi:hypothetical protein
MGGEPWTLWELDKALYDYDCVGDYYKSNKGKDVVELHENDSGVLGDSAITVTNNIEGYYLGENICVCTKLLHIREVVYW